MKARFTFVLAVVASTFVACSMAFDRSDEGPSESDDEALARVGIDPTGSGGRTYDAGVKDTGIKDSGVKDSSILGVLKFDAMVKAMDPTSSCALQRWDFVPSGRSCAAFSKTTADGVWSAVSLFPDAPPAVRDSRCALTFRANSPACVGGHPDTAFAMNCSEINSLATRSAACAADASQCTGSGNLVTTSSATAPAFKPVSNCGPFDGGHGGTGVGTCDVCGFTYGGSLYVINPFALSSIYVDIWGTGGSYLTESNQSWLVTATPQSSFRIDLPTDAGVTWADGKTVKVWWRSPMPDAGVP